MENLLTARELEICKYIAQGKSNDEIAKELHLSKHTIKVYVSNIILNFYATNRTQVAYILGKENIINM